MAQQIVCEIKGFFFAKNNFCVGYGEVYKGQSVPTQYLSKIKLKDMHPCINFICREILKEGQLFTLTGEWETAKNNKYGDYSFTTAYATKFQGNDEESIIKYISQNITGIGLVRAKNIVKIFGKDTINVFTNFPQKIIDQKIRGVTANVVLAGQEALLKNKEKNDVFEKLLMFNMSSNMKQKILEFNNALAIINRNPFEFTFNYFAGISFNAADEMFKELISKNDFDNRRIIAILYDVLKKSSFRGNVFVLENIAVDMVRKALASTENTFSNRIFFDIIEEAIKNDEMPFIVYKKGKFYIKELYAAEMSTAISIITLMQKRVNVGFDINKDIARIENQWQIQFAPEQEEAVRKALLNNVSIITGGPGTGKTTVLKAICNIYSNNSKQKEVILVAPTGKASRKMAEATGFPAYTIHKLLGLQEGSYFTDVRLEDCLLIVDEMSMVDTFLMGALMSAISNENNMKVVFVGDVDQLSSIGPGNVLKELIASKKIPTTILKFGYRFENNILVSNAHKINTKQLDISTNKDTFIFLECSEEKKIVRRCIDAYIHYGESNSIVLSPLRKNVATGCDSINTEIKKIVNPFQPNQPVIDKRFTIGDKVMQTKNTDNVTNGEVGKIIDIFYSEEDKKYIITVEFESGETIQVKNADNLDLAYSTTVHKAQGGEYETVIIPLLNSHGIMLKKNLLYTAVTRAKKRVIIIGEQSAFIKAVMTEDTTQRNTNLAELITQFKAILEE